MDNETLLKLIRTFPSLARELAAWPAPPDDLDNWLDRQATGDGGEGRKAAASFVLHMAGHAPTFDLRRAWGAWDEAHRDAAIAILRAG